MAGVGVGTLIPRRHPGKLGRREACHGCGRADLDGAIHPAQRAVHEVSRRESSSHRGLNSHGFCTLKPRRIEYMYCLVHICVCVCGCFCVWRVSLNMISKKAFVV